MNRRGCELVEGRQAACCNRSNGRTHTSRGSRAARLGHLHPIQATWSPATASSTFRSSSRSFRIPILCDRSLLPLRHSCVRSRSHFHPFSQTVQVGEHRPDNTGRGRQCASDLYKNDAQHLPRQSRTLVYWVVSVGDSANFHRPNHLDRAMRCPSLQTKLSESSVVFVIATLSGGR